MPKRTDTGKLHSLVARREELYRKYLEAHEAYLRACQELQEAINNLNE